MAIEARDFEVACEWLCGVWRGVRGETRAGRGGRGWEGVGVREMYGVKYLRITREVPIVGTTAVDPDDGVMDDHGEDEIPDEDEESVQRPGRDESHLLATRVYYDIVHSASYQVPVVYISFPDLAPTLASSPELVYRLLVPDAYKSQVQAVGVMGALSRTEHPVTGLPVWFVHPCLTQDALRAVCEEKDRLAELYLMRWFGVIGSSVGLSVPIDMAQVMQGREHDADVVSEAIDASP